MDIDRVIPSKNKTTHNPRSRDEVKIFETEREERMRDARVRGNFEFREKDYGRMMNAHKYPESLNCHGLGKPATVLD